MIDISFVVTYHFVHSLYMIGQILTCDKWFNPRGNLIALFDCLMRVVLRKTVVGSDD